MGQGDFYVCELDQDFGLLSQSEPAFTLAGGGPASGRGWGEVGTVQPLPSQFLLQPLAPAPPVDTNCK